MENKRFGYIILILVLASLIVLSAAGKTLAGAASKSHPRKKQADLAPAWTDSDFSTTIVEEEAEPSPPPPKRDRAKKHGSRAAKKVAPEPQNASAGDGAHYVHVDEFKGGDANAAEYVPVQECGHENAACGAESERGSFPDILRYIWPWPFRPRHGDDQTGPWISRVNALVARGGVEHGGIIKQLIACESGGYDRPPYWDVNGYSKGCLAFHADTWEEMLSLSGLHLKSMRFKDGNTYPATCEDAISMADWMIGRPDPDHDGRDLLYRWTCARGMPGVVYTSGP